MPNFAAVAVTVGEVKPTYGVRMRNQLKKPKNSNIKAIDAKSSKKQQDNSDYISWKDLVGER